MTNKNVTKTLQYQRPPCLFIIKIVLLRGGGAEVEWFWALPNEEKITENLKFLVVMLRLAASDIEILCSNPVVRNHFFRIRS